MASVTFKLPEDFLLALSRLGDKTDEIIPKVLEAGSAVVLEKAQGNLRAVIGKGTKHESRSTGELVRALGVSKARQDRDGNWNIKLGFSEPRRGTGNVSNAMIANIIENGKHGQPAKPFLKPAKIQTQGAAIDAMKAKFQEEVDRI